MVCLRINQAILFSSSDPVDYPNTTFIWDVVLQWARLNGTPILLLNT